MIASLQVVVFMLVLLVPVVAVAECAWVLWAYSLSQGVDLHRIELARSTRKECDKEASAFAAILKAQGYNVRGGVPGVPEVMGKKGTETVSYSCLPDTVDPRGPQGK